MEKKVERRGDTLSAFASTLRRVPPGVVALFAIAGLAAAYAGSSYSAWVGQRYAENSQNARLWNCVHDCQAVNPPGVNCMTTCEVSAHEAWYRGNLALTKYADRQWWIWSLRFPVAMSVAILLGLALDWLPNLKQSRLLEGFVLLYVSSAIAALVMIAASALFWTLAPLPASVVYAWLLARTQRVLLPNSDHTSSIFRLLLLFIPLGGILGGVLRLILPSFAWFAGVEIAWAVVFDRSLAAPAARMEPIALS